MSDGPDEKWASIAVRDVIERHFCGPSPDCEERQIFSSEEWGVLKTTAVTWNGWDETAHKVLPCSYWNQPSIEVKAGDVLVTKAGPRHRVAVVCHVESVRPQLVVSGKMIGLRPNLALVEPRVLAGLISTRDPQKYIQARTTGMAESQVNFANDVLLDAPVRLPPLDEQKVISEISLLLDTAIRETEAIIAKLKAVKQGLLHDLLTRGIDTNGELRPPQAEAPHLYKQSPLGWIPREWSISPVGAEFEIQLGKMLDSERNSGVLKPYVGNKAVQWDRIDLSEVQHVPLSQSDLSRFRLKKGDLLVCEGGDIGRAAIWEDQLEECYYQKALHRLRPTKGFRPLLMQEFLRYWTSRDLLSEYVSRTSIAHFTQEKFSVVPLPVPPISEQDKLTSEIIAMRDRQDREQAELNKLSVLKAGLMDDLLTGRVRVTPLLPAEQQAQTRSA